MNPTTTNKSDLSAALQTIKYDAEVPYHTITYIALIAFLSPLATLLWSVHHANNPDIDLHGRRYLQNQTDTNQTDYCDMTATANDDVSTWVAIRSTIIISASVAFLCLLAYELFRRDPIIGKYVYDRKRLTQPDRTPPPLMRSRSLWCGHEGEDDGVTNKRRWCKVMPSILELIFLNLGENYIRYSHAANEARKEREKRGYYGSCWCCRPGCYHNNCCNKIRLINSCSAEDEGDEEFVDEDGYVFHPGYCQDYSHIYKHNRETSTIRNRGTFTEIAEEVQSPKWRKTIADLFPEDDPRLFFAKSRTQAQTIGLLRAGFDIEAQGDEDPSDSNGENDKRPESLSDSFYSAKSCEFDETEEELVCSKVLRRTGSEHQSARDAGIKPLEYPSRLSGLFLPPGFHSWSGYFDWLGYFFLLPGFVKWCRKHIIAKIPIFSPISSPKKTDNNYRKGRLSFATLTNPGKDLTEGEKELLRCAGLDTYLLVRLARFGFDVTCYPFLSACVTILPIYHSCTDQSSTADDGYLTLTINQIPEGSGKMIWILVFTILLYLYIMRRLWLEWEVFIKLRHSFLSNGDKSFHKSPTYLQKFRNTCIVECVPKSHRSDRKLNSMFESLYPGQIEHSEMLIDTSKLEEILNKRRKLIEKYDDIDARHRYERYRYETWQREGKAIGCCRNRVSEPVEPQVRDGLCSGKKEDAFPYLNNKITDIDALADEEYDSIVETRQKWRDDLLQKSLGEGEDFSDAALANSLHSLYTLFVPSHVRRFFGEDSEFFYGTGMVTFKSIATKQGAVQCNLSGRPYWMIAQDAPDPRDLFWDNIGVDRTTMENRKILVQFVLLVGILGWGAIVTVINNFTRLTIESIDNENLTSGLIQGYLPVLVVSIVLLWLPNLFLLIAMRVIRFKSHTQCDEFVLMWNTGYRLANIFFTFFSISLYQALQCFKESPDKFVEKLADGVIRQSSFLMNLIILATGQETMLQLLQWRSLLKQALFRPIINLNTRSRRYIDWLNAAPAFEKSFIFGFYAPVLSYGLMIAMVFAFMAPIMLGVCAVFFWTATKVHTHNALFVYCQRCEGGGKIFYYWNRIVFITLYSSIVLFSGILTLKKYITMGLLFFFIMTLITFSVDKSVENTFVVHSLHLPISIARIHDEEEAVLLAESNLKPDGGENFMYRHPILNQENWNATHTW